MPYADSNGIRIRYEIDGSGEPLVLHPGFIGSLEDWDDAGYVSTLSDQYAVIRLDPRGQGHSDAPHDPVAYAVANRVSDVLAVLDSEGINHAHFWGYSMGGGVGFALGKAAPDRLCSLILGAPSPFQERVDPNEPDGMLADLRTGMTALVNAWEAVASDFWLSDGERTRWVAADAAALAAARKQRLQEPYIGEDELASIAIPTLLYVGDHDSMGVQAAVERAAQLMPHAELVVLEGLNHAQALARSDLVLPRVQAFLGRLGHGANSRW